MFGFEAGCADEGETRPGGRIGPWPTRRNTHAKDCEHTVTVRGVERYVKHMRFFSLRPAACRHMRARNARAHGSSRSAARAASDVVSVIPVSTSAQGDASVFLLRAWRLIGQASRPGSASSPAVPRLPTHRTGANRHGKPRARIPARLRAPFFAVAFRRASRTVTKDAGVLPTHARTSDGAKPFSPYGRLPKSTHVPGQATCLARGGLPERPRHSMSVSVLESVATARGRTQGRVASKRSGRRARASRTRSAAPAPACRERGWKSLASNRARGAQSRLPSRVDRALPFSGRSFGKGKRCCRHAPAPPVSTTRTRATECACPLRAGAGGAVRGHGTRCQLGLRGRRAMWREECEWLCSPVRDDA
ncbi:hypothetical protein ERJ75_001388400 [Trypanosoma vivax]|nr:hypothetical protein ERJ75_001388400 [Trypanosoma vivax]